MDLYTLSIGPHIFTLSRNADIPQLQMELTDLVRSGGGMIDLPSIGEERVSVLVSPGLAVVFRSRTLPEDEVDDASIPWTSIYLAEPDWEFS